MKTEHPAAPSAVRPSPLAPLRRYTSARIALGHAGVSLPTAPQLAFQLAHAQARDAVHRRLDAPALAASVRELGLETIVLHSAAADRPIYLQRPDLGRRLDEASEQALAHWRAARPGATHDLAVVIGDGLSALAIERHAVPFVGALRAALGDGWRWAPVAVVEQARVAVGDPIGAALGAALLVVLIGERPGLSSPDSMGLYVTASPRPGRRDSERNCISNVRPEGLPLADAATRLAWLLQAARARGLTGVELKDESAAPAGRVEHRADFLLG